MKKEFSEIITFTTSTCDPVALSFCVASIAVLGKSFGAIVSFCVKNLAKSLKTSNHLYRI